MSELVQPMQSPVNWALLGLVIDRPSYAYELAQRFERVYEGVLSLSSASHAYTALEALLRRSLIEEAPGTGRGRQPRPRYRATAEGVAAYRDWLVGQAHEDRRRQRLFALQLAAFTHDPEAALETVERYRQACLREARQPPPARVAEPSGSAPELIARLLSEESRLAAQARLSWVEYVRHELEAMTRPYGMARGAVPRTS